MRNFEILTANEMQGISGAQVETCEDFTEVLRWLETNGHMEQAGVVFSTYLDQYCF